MIGIALPIAAAAFVVIHPVVPPEPGVSIGITLAPAVVVGGNPTVATVTLSAPAPPVGTPVSVSTSSITVAGLVSPLLGPLSSVSTLAITVPGGARSVTVAIQTFGVVSSTSVVIRASSAGETTTATLIVNPATLKAFAIAPATVTGGHSTVATLTLDGKAPESAGATVSLSATFASASTSNLGDGSVRTVTTAPAAASVPASVAIRGGATGASFTIPTAGGTSTTTASVVASLGGVTRTASLRIDPPLPTTVQLNPTAVMGGAGSTGTVVLNSAAAAPGQSIFLTSSAAEATVPRSVVVPAGADRVTFPVTTQSVTSARTASISARSTLVTSSPTITDGTSNTIIPGESSASASATLSILPPPQLQSLSSQPSTVIAGAPVSLSLAFSSGSSVATSGAAALLVADHPEVLQLPASLPLTSSTTTLTLAPPAATVSVPTLLPASDQPVTVTASLGAQRVTTTFTVIRPLASFGVGPGSVVGGAPLVGTVVPATTIPGPITIAFATDHPEIVQVQSTATVIPGGVARVPFRTSPVTTETQVTITATVGAQRISGTVRVTPPG